MDDVSYSGVTLVNTLGQYATALIAAGGLHVCLHVSVRLPWKYDARTLNEINHLIVMMKYYLLLLAFMSSTVALVHD